MERRESDIPPLATTESATAVPDTEGQTLASATPPALPCANCGSALVGPFCARCGQNVADHHQSIWRFVADFFDNAFCWDNKLFRTLGPLFRRPGFLTREFLAGRRVRYVHPLRLFLFTSAVCLAVLHFSEDRPSNTAASKHHEKDAKSVPVAPPALPSASPPDSPATAASPTPPERPVKLDDPEIEKAINDALKDKLGGRKAGEVAAWSKSLGAAFEQKMANGGMERFSHEFMDGVRQRLSWMTLALLPVFALMLRGLYWRKDTYYFLHLVFSLHYHTFLLMFWTAYSWLGAVFPHDGEILLLVCPPVYLFFALRGVYGGSARRTWLKALVLGGMHILAIIAGLGTIGALSFFSAMR